MLFINLGINFKQKNSKKSKMRMTRNEYLISD